MINESILIIDHDPQIRKLLKIILESQQYKVLEAVAATDGVFLAANHAPDLILLDLELSNVSGYELLLDLRTWYEKAIVILSAEDAEEDIVKSLDNGATDYLIKPFKPEELLARINSSIRLHRNFNNLHSVVSEDLEIDLRSNIVYLEGSPINLTTKEFNLLNLLARNQGKVLTHQYLLRNIWGIAFQKETQYLRVIMAQLRRKLEKNPNAPVHFITQIGVGYRFL